MKSIMAHDPRVRISFLACVFLASCQIDADLNVRQRPDGKVEFHVTSAWGNDETCINMISILHKEAGQVVSDWHASDHDPNVCSDRIFYGEANSPFRAERWAQPLVPHRYYEVIVYGVGFTAGGNFRITDQGVEFSELR
jgi:hypothetical protein